MRVMAFASTCALLATGCDHAPGATAVIDNRYPPSSTSPLIVYRAQFETAFFPTPVVPGASSDPQDTVPTSGDWSVVLLAPGWDAASDARPTSFVVMESISQFAVQTGGTVHIPVDDSTFRGNCDAGSFLTQEEATVLIQAFFPEPFKGLSYDAASCTTTPIPDGGSGQ
jgi:hypothetical protein